MILCSAYTTTDFIPPLISIECVCFFLSTILVHILLMSWWWWRWWYLVCDGVHKSFRCYFFSIIFFLLSPIFFSLSRAFCLSIWCLLFRTYALLQLCRRFSFSIPCPFCCDETSSYKHIVLKKSLPMEYQYASMQRTYIVPYDETAIKNVDIILTREKMIKRNIKRNKTCTPLFI